MRLKYGFWACPVPGCPKLSTKQIRCPVPAHNALMCKVTLELQKPKRPPPDLGRAIDDLVRDIRQATGE